MWRFANPALKRGAYFIASLRDAGWRELSNRPLNTRPKAVARHIAHPAAALIGSTRDEMFQQMAKPPAKPLAFMNAPGAHPRLHTCHGCGVVFFDDNFQAVWKRETDTGWLWQRRYLSPPLQTPIPTSS